MAVWKTLKRTRFKRRGNEVLTVELRSRKEDETETKFITICKAFVNKDKDVRYKGSISLPSRHIDGIIECLTKLKDEVVDNDE